jgi:hypothetical protein
MSTSHDSYSAAISIAAIMAASTAVAAAHKVDMYISTAPLCTTTDRQQIQDILYFIGVRFTHLLLLLLQVQVHSSSLASIVCRHVTSAAAVINRAPEVDETNHVSSRYIHCRTRAADAKQPYAARQRSMYVQAVFTVVVSEELSSSYTHQ